MSNKQNDINNEQAYERLQEALEELNEVIIKILDDEILSRKLLRDEVKRTIDLLE